MGRRERVGGRESGREVEWERKVGGRDGKIRSPSPSKLLID